MTAETWSTLVGPLVGVLCLTVVFVAGQLMAALCDWVDR